MNKLCDSENVTIERGVSNCWKADGLIHLRMPDKTKILLACSHILTGCNRVRFHQLRTFGSGGWSVMDFSKAKQNPWLSFFLHQSVASILYHTYNVPPPTKKNNKPNKNLHPYLTCHNTNTTIVWINFISGGTSLPIFLTYTWMPIFFLTLFYGQIMPWHLTWGSQNMYIKNKLEYADFIQHKMSKYCISCKSV